MGTPHFSKAPGARLKEVPIPPARLEPMANQSNFLVASCAASDLDLAFKIVLDLRLESL